MGEIETWLGSNDDGWKDLATRVLRDKKKEVYLEDMLGRSDYQKVLDATWGGKLLQDTFIKEHLREHEREQCKFENVTSGILLAKKICDTICANDPERIRDIESAEEALKDPESDRRLLIHTSTWIQLKVKM